MDILAADYQNGMERSCTRSKACHFFLFLKIYCAHVSLHLFPFIFFPPRLISLFVLWKTWRVILRHGLECLRFSKLVEMSSLSHDCRLVNWEIFQFSNFLQFDLDNISIHAKPPIYLTSDFKRAEKEAD